MNIKKNYSLSNYNSFCVDHSTRYFIEIENKNQIVSFLKDKKYLKIDKLILGGGSNILFTKDFSGVVLFEYPRKGIWALGFVTTEAKGEIADKKGDNLLCIFAPTTPNPTSGYLLFVPKEDTIEMDMTVEEAAKLIISAGLVVPDQD